MAPLLESARLLVQPLDLQILNLTWKPPNLTITITRPDAPSSITADDCAATSSHLAVLLDEEFSTVPYTLEVSTPGASNSLDLDCDRIVQAFKGFPVKLMKKDGVKFKGKRIVHGRFAEVDDDFVWINVKGRKVKIDKDVVEDVVLCTATEIAEMMK